MRSGMHIVNIKPRQPKVNRCKGCIHEVTTEVGIEVYCKLKKKFLKKYRVLKCSKKHPKKHIID